MKKLILLTLTTACLGIFQAEAHETNTQSKEITPNAGPHVIGGTNIFVTADFIWWKPVQEGLNYALTGVRARPGTTLSSRGTEHTLDFSWEPGFKAGLGFHLPHDGWDLYIQYTWIQSLNNKNTATSGNGNLEEQFTLGSSNAAANIVEDITKATSSWDLHFNALNIELGRNFYVSQFLSLRPFGGAKVTWQCQKWNILFDANNVQIDPPPLAPPTPGSVRSIHNHDTWGVGIRTGLNGQWLFTKHWGLFANTALAAMWTNYDVDRKDAFHPNNVQNGTIALYVERDDHRVRAVTELQLGLRGQWWPSNGQYHVSVQAAYEQQVWINYGSYIFVAKDTDNDLAFHGLNVAIRFDF